MLEPVAAQRAGGAFRVPGLFQDARGIVVSHEAAVLVHSQDQLLSFLRIVSEETSLRELLSGLHSEELRSTIGGQAFFLRVALSDSRALDRAARAAAFCGGQLSVGSGRHFVRYRDAQAPYGYDALSIHTGSDGDYAVYTPRLTQLYQRTGELQLAHLITQQRLLPRIGGLDAALRQHDRREPLWLLVPAVLRPRLLRYLWLRRVDVGLVLPEPTVGTDVASSLLQVSGDLAQTPGALLGLPGVHWLLPQSDHIAVELGHTHPLNLQAFSSWFSDTQRHLFLAAPQGLVTLPASPFVPARCVVQVDAAESPPRAPAASQPDRAHSPSPSPGRLGTQLPIDLSQLTRVRLALVQEHSPMSVPAAVHVPWSQLATLTQLAYRLPPASLASLQAVALDSGLLILGDVSHAPLGEPYYEAAPKVLVPLGLTVVPRLPASLLRSRLSASDDAWLLLRPSARRDVTQRSEPAVRDTGQRLPAMLHEIPASALVTLIHLLVARLDALPLVEQGALSADEPPPQVVYPSLGWLWPLWGGPRPQRSDPRALPAASPTAALDEQDEDPAS